MTQSFNHMPPASRMGRIAAASTRWIILAGATFSAAACATTGATLGSGVGERYFDEAPYYSGRIPDGTDHRIAHLPIRFQAGATQPEFFEPDGGEGSALEALLKDMNRYLEALGASVSLAPPDLEQFVAPDVRFGCEPAAIDECDSESSDFAIEGRPWMKLSVGRPSPEWTAALGSALAASGRDYALVITLEIGQYWTRPKNLLGSKEVRLGTGHDQPIPWLTSLDQPVEVIQLTGALIAPDGRATRIGAEGLFAQRSNILLSGFGARRLIADETLEALRVSRREDLPGKPLVWEVAIENLVAGLLGIPDSQAM